MKQALGILIVLSIFTSVLSTRNGNNRDYQNKWRGQSENSEYPKIVEVIRWRQSVCVLPGPNVPPCFTALRKYQDEYEAISAEGIEPNSEHRDEVKALKKTRATSFDNINVENGVTKILTPRITNFIYVDAFPRDKLQSSENTNYRDLSVHSSTPEIDHAYVRREGRYLVFSPVKTAPTVAKTRAEISVTKVLNSPVTATLVANNCFPDIGVPLCNDYQETIPASGEPSSESITRDPDERASKNFPEKALVDRPASPCISSSCSSSSPTPTSPTPTSSPNESVSKAIIRMELEPRGITHGQSHPVGAASSKPKPGFVSGIFDIPKPIFAHFGGDIFDKRNETPILNVDHDPHTVQVHDYDKKSSVEMTRGQAGEPQVTVVNREPVLQSKLPGKPAKQPIFFEHFWRTGDIFRKKIFITTTSRHEKHNSDDQYTGDRGKTENIEERADNRKKYEASAQRPEYFGGLFKNFTRPCAVNKSIEKMKNLWGFSKSYLPDLHNKRIIINRPGAKPLLVQKMMNVSEKLAPGGLFGLRSTADGRPLFDINHEINKEYAHVDINPSSGVLSRVFSTIYRPGFIQHSFSIRKQKLSGNEKNHSANVQPENNPSRIHQTNDSTSVDNDGKTPCTEPPKIEEITVTIVRATDGKSKNEEKIEITKETIDEMIPKISQAENFTKVESTLSAVNFNDEKSKHDENTEVTKEVSEKPDGITKENVISIDGEASLSNATDGESMQDEDVENATENDKMTDELNEKVEIPENNDDNEKEISSTADTDENFEGKTVVANKTIEKDIAKVSEGVDFFEEGMPSFNATDQLSKDDENDEIATTILEALAEELDRMSKISEYDDVTSEDIMSSGLNDTHREFKDNEDPEKAEKKSGEITEKKGENPEKIEKTIQAITEGSLEITNVPEDVGIVENKLTSAFNNTHQESIHEEDTEDATEQIQEITAKPEQITNVSEDVIVIGGKNSPPISNVSEQTPNPHDNVEVAEETTQEVTEGPVEIARGTENVVAVVTEEFLSSAVNKDDHESNSDEDAEVATETIQEITEGPVEIAKGIKNVVVGVTEEVVSSTANNNDQKFDLDDDAKVAIEIIQEITEGPAEITKNTENVVADGAEEVLSSAVNKNRHTPNPEEDVEIITETIQEITEGPVETANGADEIVSTDADEGESSAANNDNQKTDLEEDAEVTTEIIQEMTEGPAEIAKNTEIVVADVTEEVLSSAANNRDRKTDLDIDAEVTTDIIQEIIEEPAEIAKNTENVVADPTEEVISSTVSNNDQKTELDEDAEVATEIVQETTEGPAEIAKNTDNVLAVVVEQDSSAAVDKNDLKLNPEEDAEVTTETDQGVAEEPIDIAEDRENIVSGVTEEALSPTVNKNEQKTDHEEDAEVTTERTEESTAQRADTENVPKYAVVVIAEKSKNTTESKLPEDAEAMSTVPEEMTEKPADDVKISDQLIVTEATFENFADIEITENTEKIATAPKENFTNSVIAKLAHPVETATSDP